VGVDAILKASLYHLSQQMTLFRAAMNMNKGRGEGGEKQTAAVAIAATEAAALVVFGQNSKQRNNISSLFSSSSSSSRGNNAVLANSATKDLPGRCAIVLYHLLASESDVLAVMGMRDGECLDAMLLTHAQAKEETKRSNVKQSLVSAISKVGMFATMAKPTAAKPVTAAGAAGAAGASTEQQQQHKTPTTAFRDRPTAELGFSHHHHVGWHHHHHHSGSFSSHQKEMSVSNRYFPQDVLAGCASVLAKTVLLHPPAPVMDPGAASSAGAADAAAAAAVAEAESENAANPKLGVGVSIMVRKGVFTTVVLALMHTYSDLVLAVNAKQQTDLMTKSVVLSLGVGIDVQIVDKDDEAEEEGEKGAEAYDPAAAAAAASAASSASPLFEQYGQVVDDIEQALCHLCSKPLQAQFVAFVDAEGGVDVLRQQAGDLCTGELHAAGKDWIFGRLVGVLEQEI